MQVDDKLHNTFNIINDIIQKYKQDDEDKGKVLIKLIRENITNITNTNITNTNKQSLSPSSNTNALAGGKRKQSKYNIFMKNEIERLKKLNPNKDHKLRFKEAVLNWNKKMTNK